ncbi:MAG: molybdopterin oxidoreductase [Verrucomicrobia bacterium]|nr:MAG: molybdopterin oxidoreductase [Verrucomicrobiota bacterium]
MKPDRSGPMHEYWRSLDERAGTPEFERWLHGEFPAAAEEWVSDIHRREFLRLMGASAALAGLGACTKQPLEKIAPYVEQPEQIVPGKPLHFATATTFAGYAQGIVVTSHEGRPTKIEGKPEHPASLGATTVWAQADVVDLYDPDRAQAVTKAGQISTWDDFLQELNVGLEVQQQTGGSGLRILTQTVTSPTLGRQLADLAKKFPNARWHQWDPMTRENAQSASATGENIYSVAAASVIVSLDSDFLYFHPAALRYAREFASARRLTQVQDARMSRLYVAEPTPTITGANADHRIAVPARNIEIIANALAQELGVGEGTASTSLPDPIAKWIKAAAQDLSASLGRSIVIAGETQPPAVHILVDKINHQLGNIGRTILPGRQVVVNSIDQTDSVRALIRDLNNGAVDLLLIIGGNPVFDAPVDLAFTTALGCAKLRVHHSLHTNETSLACHWHIPAAHFLESWSDALAFDGTATVIQPLIEPLYAGLTTHELVEAFIHQPVRNAFEIVRESWRAAKSSSDFDLDWRRALNHGVVPQPSEESMAAPIQTRQSRVSNQAGGLEILFRPDPNILDGRYANNAWLQEMPRPLTKICWDNAAIVSPQLAKQEALKTGDIVELQFRGKKIAAPVWIQPGQSENSITVHFGNGRREVGRVGRGVGFNAYELRTSDALWFGDGLTLRKTGAKHEFATTQHHHAIEGRHMFRAGTLAQFSSDPGFASKMAEVPKREETLYNPDEFKNAGYAWGMVIDLTACIGCNSCTIACQAENNIPVVGKYQVSVGREMQWIRIDSYYNGPVEAPELNHQPVPCMHCEHAPCELVCPVGATVHDNEGLNLQVYNRCVGTRYCSNNCPYKVRRFNFFELNGKLSPVEKLGKNPDVTVRSRGVMEKCTYCVQRINAARHVAELDHDRSIRDGEVVPACAQVCPTEAIIFGDINNPNSRVSEFKRSPLNYGMLAELNTRPRTTYLAKLRNPNPELVSL